MSMIEDMTKEKQALSDECKKQMDETKGVSTNVPIDNKFDIYQQISYMEQNRQNQIRSSMSEGGEPKVLNRIDKIR
jgi:hypothetical protein